MGRKNEIQLTNPFSSSTQLGGSNRPPPKRRPCLCRGLCGLTSSARSCFCCSPLCCLVTLVVCFGLFLAIMHIGSSIEQAEVAKAADTAWVYGTPDVCSVDNTTYGSTGAAHAAGKLVRHCGACGQCSNDHDVRLYEDTKDTLTESSTACAVLSITQGASGVTACFDQTVNMTRGCTRCWVENVMCDLKRCVFSCLLYRCVCMCVCMRVCMCVCVFSCPLYRMGMGGSTNTGEVEGALSDCLKCDEKMCGPAFIKCAGANRRRSGIQSDIERNDTHVCKVVDVGPGASTASS